MSVQIYMNFVVSALFFIGLVMQVNNNIERKCYETWNET